MCLYVHHFFHIKKYKCTKSLKQKYTFIFTYTYSVAYIHVMLFKIFNTTIRTFSPKSGHFNN